MWWLILPALLAIFVAVLLIRAARFAPPAAERPQTEPVKVNEGKITDDMVAFIRCKTVSSRDKSQEDAAEFEKFRQVLQERFPQVHAACTLERIGEKGLLYHWKGRSDAAPSVYMAHYDVVPATEEDWDKPAFEGVIEDGVLWGRGTLDTKGTLLGVMEAAEHLLAEGFVPENDIYFSFAGDEEIAGEGAPAIVDELERRRIRPAMVIDEGGAVVEGVFPGVKQPCALVGIGEKGMMDVELTVKSMGGHASSPPPHTPVGVLAQAVARVENHPFPARLTKPAAEMFDTLGRHSSLLYRVIFANLWCFGGVLSAMTKKSGGELNALLRTTCAFTMMQGSRASNVLPPEAKVGANLRLMGGDTLQSAQARLEKIIANGNVTCSVVHGMNPSPFSSTDSPGWRRVKNAIQQTWPEALVSPYLMIACSDSRHFCRISDHVYRFSAMALSKEERGAIHGNNERVPLEKLVTTVQFYVRLMRHS